MLQIDFTKGNLHKCFLYVLLKIDIKNYNAKQI